MGLGRSIDGRPCPNLRLIDSHDIMGQLRRLCGFVRTCGGLVEFKRQLKTYLFTNAFN